MVRVYNEYLMNSPQEGYAGKVEEFITADPKRISWSRALKNDLIRGKSLFFREDAIVR